jgi:threonine dehydrogenase-like Zn-dependent dehydrogenase
MEAVVFENGVAGLVRRPRPEPGPDEALVRVRLAGVCNTDIELLRGYMGFAGIPGHEFVGEVVAAPGSPGLVGRRVAADINFGCGVCLRCRAGDPRHCPERTTLGIAGKDGAFAQFLTVPTRAVHVLPDSLSDTQAVFLEPLAAALEPGQQLHFTARQSVLVLGDGKLGILTACSLRHLVPGLVLGGKHASKLAIAAAQGVTTRQGDTAEGLAQALAREYGRFDCVIEATGRPQGLETALDLVRPEGTIVLKTTTFALTSLNMARVVVDEINLVGSRCGDLALALAYLQDGLVDVVPLVEATYPLADFQTALDHAARPGAMKVLLDLR